MLSKIRQFSGSVNKSLVPSCTRSITKNETDKKVQSISTTLNKRSPYEDLSYYNASFHFFEKNNCLS